MLRTSVILVSLGFELGFIFLFSILILVEVLIFVVFL